jgi:RNA recognition motif-containing protein
MSYNNSNNNGSNNRVRDQSSSHHEMSNYHESSNVDDYSNQNTQLDTDPDAGKKSQSFCLFLGDLSYFCGENDLQNVFQRFGYIEDVRIIRNKTTKKSLSYGFIEFATASSAVNALKEMNGAIVCGRAIRLVIIYNTYYLNFILNLS